MKKLPFWVKIILPILLVAALVGLLLGGTIYDFSKTTTLATGEVVPNVYAVKTGTVNCYLVKAEGGYIMIDTGSNKEQAEEALQVLGISPEEIIAVLLTHSDDDHTAAIPLFPNAQLYVAEAEVALIDGTTNRFKGLLALINSVPSIDGSYVTLKDNDIIEIGGYAIRSIATPGHTPGSICYLFDDNYLFTGDAMGLINGKAGLFISIFNMDEDTQAKSISKLAAVQTQYIFTSHHGYSDNRRFVFEDWN